MEINYFSWIKNSTGVAKEIIDLPEDIDTVKKLIDWLVIKDEKKYKEAFSYIETINISVNDAMIENNNNFLISNNDRISFFSAMAGG